MWSRWSPDPPDEEEEDPAPWEDDAPDHWWADRPGEKADTQYAVAASSWEDPMPIAILLGSKNEP